MSESQPEAIVIGGGVGGLAAAKALSDRFDRVTVIERDVLPHGPENRKGVPQGHQTHALMPLGRDSLESLFPGFIAGIEADGVPITDIVRDMAYWGPWGWRARGASTVKTVNVRRPYLEHHMRERVRAVANVEILVGSVEGLLSSQDNARITGVKVAGEGLPAELRADLVVDASGRGSRATSWLEELGYEAPEELTVSTNCGYSSRLLRFPEGTEPKANTIVALPYPGQPKGAHLFRQEAGLWILTALGMNREYPPRGEDELVEWVGQASTPYIAEAVRPGEWVSDLKTYRFARNRRARWERLARRPRGFIPLGDTIACFNPIYGQGMSVASFEARALRDTLTKVGRDLDTLPEEYLAAAVPAIDWAFLTATTFDATYPDVEIHGEMDLASDEELMYILHVDQLAAADPAMHELFYRYLGGMETEVFSEETRARVAEWVAQGNEPRYTDPMSPPAPPSQEPVGASR